MELSIKMFKAKCVNLNKETWELQNDFMLEEEKDAIITSGIITVGPSW